MKRLGAYISPHADTASSSPYFTKGCFVYYEVFAQMPRIGIWRLDNTKINQQPDEVIFLKSPSELKEHIATYETWANHYISYHDQTYRIRNIAFRYARLADIEIVDELTVDAVDHYETLKHEDSSAYRFLKEAKLTDMIYKPSKFKIDYTRARPITAAYEDLVMPVTIKEELKKSLINSYYGMGSFTTRPVLSPEEIGKMFDSKNKETETMEKKKMTDTDRFMRHNHISITSTHARMNRFDDSPYDIYYPEMEITPSVAENLITVLLLMRNAFVHKLIFNPKKRTTTIKLRCQSVTVRCNEADDAEFNFVMGFVMANMKREFGSDDYNWFNKIKNHRKTHIEYTEKKPTKKGGKK